MTPSAFSKKLPLVRVATLQKRPKVTGCGSCSPRQTGKQSSRSSDKPSRTLVICSKAYRQAQPGSCENPLGLTKKLNLRLSCNPILN